MNITVNPIEVNTQNEVIKCDFCSKEFGSQTLVDKHILEAHSKDEKKKKNELYDVVDELEEITFDIVDDKTISKYKNSVNKNTDTPGEYNSISVQPVPYASNPIPQVSSNKICCCCVIDNSSKENNYEQYSYKPEHNPEGCCDCEGVDCDNCCSDCGNCEDCNWGACCTECGSCITDCNCNCDECVII